jgi:Leucine-rich repeat (LRR) protein
MPYSYSKAVQISNDDSLSPTIDIPEVAFGQSVGLRLDVVFTTGETRSDFVYIRIRNFPDIADVAFNDPVLQQCIDDAATANSLVDSGELTDLVCAGISDAAELEVFNNLVTVNFSGNTLVSLQPIIALEDLEYLDISGNPSLMCSEIDELAQRLTRGVDLIVDDECLSGANSQTASLHDSTTRPGARLSK